MLQVNHFKGAQSRKNQVRFNHFNPFQLFSTTSGPSIFTGVSDFDFTGFAFGTLAGFVALAFGLGELELCRA